MAYNVISKGSDETIQLTLIDEKGEPIVVSELEDVIVRVYQTPGAILQENKLSDDTITPVEATENKIKFPLYGQTTLHIATKRLFLEIITEKTDETFVGGIKKTKVSGIELADLITPATNG